MQDEPSETETNPRCPNEFEDFDIQFRISLPVKRSERSDRAIWSENRVTNVMMLVLGLGSLFGFYVIPFLNREAILEEAELVPLVLFGVVAVVLFVPTLALVGLGLTHRPRLIIDRRNRQLVAMDGPLRRVRARISFDDIEELGVTLILSMHDGDTGVFKVLYAELKNGQFASLAIDPPPDLLRDLRGATGR